MSGRRLALLALVGLQGCAGAISTRPMPEDWNRVIDPASSGRYCRSTGGLAWLDGGLSLGSGAMAVASGIKGIQHATSSDPHPAEDAYAGAYLLTAGLFALGAYAWWQSADEGITVNGLCDRFRRQMGRNVMRWRRQTGAPPGTLPDPQ